MLINSVTNTLGGLLGGLLSALASSQAPVPTPSVAPASNPVTEANNGVVFDLGPKPVETNTSAMKDAASQTPASQAENNASNGTSRPVEENETAVPGNAVAVSPSRSQSPGLILAEDAKPASASATAEQPDETDPSEEARARAHAEQQLEVQRQRNLAISGYDASRRLLDVVAPEGAAVTTSASRPVREAA